MRLVFLIVAFIPLSTFASTAKLCSLSDDSIPHSTFVSTLNPRSLFDSILFNLPRSNGGMNWIKSFLANFHPVGDAYYVSIMLQYRKVPYRKFYEDIVESPERQIQLFDNLFNPTNENNSNETFFSPRKLQRNLILAKKIFLEVEPVAYKGRFFAPGLNFRSDHVYKKDKELAMAMLRFVIREQMGMVNGLTWLDHFLEVAEKDDVCEIFKLLIDCHELTPEIFQHFRNHWKETKQKSLIGDYLYPGLVLSREELLMRCALLQSSVGQPISYAGCRGLDPRNNLNELWKIALYRKDRQSISVLFYWKARDQEDGLKISEMLGYVKLGGLSPLTTGEFVRWALYENAEFVDWPLGHFQNYLSQASRWVPKEYRLSEWLCSDALNYKDESVTNFDRVYEYPVRISVNTRLTEPMKMKDGQIITWAAEYCISSAQAVLDAHRGDQQGPEIPPEDHQKIVEGILYALAEGRHLDFSNTRLEMPEGSKKWDWFKNFAEYRYYAATMALKYLSSDEIYELVHRAEVKPCVQDEQVAEVGEWIARL